MGAEKAKGPIGAAVVALLLKARGRAEDNFNPERLLCVLIVVVLYVILITLFLTRRL